MRAPLGSFRTVAWPIIGPITLFTVAGVYGCFLGAGTDRDSVRVIQSAHAILGGHYLRSRSWGFPLHEAASAVLLGIGGPFAVNLGSFLVTLAGIAMAMRVVSKVAPERAALAAAVLCGSPLLLANAGVAIDFGWSFAAGMALLWAALRLAAGCSASALTGFGAAIFTAILLRPDNALFAAALTVAILWERPAWRGTVSGVALGALALALGVYIALNGAGGWQAHVASARPWPARLARAVVSGSAALGPGGLIAVAALARVRMTPAARLSFRACCLAWVLYVPRFVALPDQAEYLILPVELSLLLAVCLAPRRAAIACAAVTCGSAFVSLAMFARDKVDGALRIAPSVVWGPVVQDWAARRSALDMELPGVAALVLSRLPAQGRPELLRYDIFMPGFVSPAHDLVIGRMQLYRVLPAGGGAARIATVPRGYYRAIYACDLPLGPGIGWRGWERPVSSRVAASLRCWLADPPK